MFRRTMLLLDRPLPIMRTIMRSLVICAALMGCGVTVAQAQDAIHWYHDLPRAQQAAAQSNRLVLIHFVGRNCAPCERIEANVHPLLAVEALMVQLRVAA